MLIVDSNVWFDAADADSAHHVPCARLLQERRQDLATPAVVIGEAARLIRYKLGAAAEARCLRLVTSDTVEILDLSSDDWVRATELVETYLDRPLGVIDAAVVALAERHGVTELASMNGRDFYLVRPATPQRSRSSPPVSHARDARRLVGRPAPPVTVRPPRMKDGSALVTALAGRVRPRCGTLCWSSRYSRSWVGQRC